MTAATKKLRAAVAKRAGGHCECGCTRFIGFDGEHGHLDHAFGRAKAPQSIENAWLLSIQCDAAKTNNDPTATHWFTLFAAHARRHGYIAETTRAEARIGWLAAKGMAP